MRRVKVEITITSESRKISREVFDRDARDDQMLVEIARVRADEKGVLVSLDDLSVGVPVRCV